MTESNEKQTAFFGTYFDRDAVLRLAKMANIAAWIALIFYVGQVVFSIGVYILQISRGLLVPLGFTDVLQSLLWFIQPGIPGLWYFIGIQAVGNLMLIFMDIEDNTRRATRK